jgi:hypothetical protein
MMGTSSERPEPSDKPDTVALGPGPSEYAYTLQALGRVERELGGLGAKLDRVIQDSEKHATKLDELRHQVSFVKGAFWVITAIAAILAFFLANKVRISFGDAPPQSAAVSGPKGP